MSIPIRVDPAIKPHVASRELGPIAPDHPLAGYVCPICDRDLVGHLVALVFVGRFPENPASWTAASVAVHDSCVAA